MTYLGTLPTQSGVTLSLQFREVLSKAAFDPSVVQSGIRPGELFQLRARSISGEYAAEHAVHNFRTPPIFRKGSGHDPTDHLKMSSSKALVQYVQAIAGVQVPVVMIWSFRNQTPLVNIRWFPDCIPLPL
jgi:hypothetical protein